MNPKKSMVSRYSVQPVNSQYFGPITISHDPASGITIATKKLGDQGYIYAPYVSIQTPPIVWMSDPIETQEQKAKRIRETRNKKLKRIFDSSDLL